VKKKAKGQYQERKSLLDLLPAFKKVAAPQQANKVRSHHQGREEKQQIIGLKGAVFPTDTIKAICDEESDYRVVDLEERDSQQYQAYQYKQVSVS
jgi:hypothetical protein